MCRKLIHVFCVILLFSLTANAQENQIVNGEFDEGFEPWGLYTYQNTTDGFTVEVVQNADLSGTNAAMFDITNSTALASIGIAQAGLVIEPGVTYPIGFTAKADQNRGMVVLLQGDINGASWPEYLTQTVHLTTMPQKFTFNYTHSGSTIGDDEGEELILYLMLKGPWWHPPGENLNGKVWIDCVYFGAETAPQPIARATNPNPADDALLLSFIGGILGANLTWKSGDFAETHDVYFGDNFDDVNDGTGGTFQGNQTNNYFIVGYGYTPNDPLPGGFVPGTTYYWRIDEVNDSEPNSPWRGDVWSFTIPPTNAYTPTPSDGSKFIDPGADLSWEPGLGAIMQTVYFGDNYETVKNATTGGKEVGIAAYDPGPLEYDKTYYWRVETVSIYGSNKGDIWSFTTARAGGGLRGDYYHWSGDFPPSQPFQIFVLSRIDPQVNFSWGDPGSPDPLVNNDRFACRWVGEVEAAFTETYTFYTTTDDGARLWVDGKEIIATAWREQGMVEWGGTIDLVAGQKYSIEMWMYENAGGAGAQLRWSSPHTPKQLIPQAALSPPVKASSPNPPNGATGTKMTPNLTWNPGDHAVSHEVYFGTNYDAVNNSTTASPEYAGPKALGDESYEPGKLEWFTTYYWRVDEINNTHPDSPWKGNIWSFTTGDFLVVDNFEDYNVTNKQIWAIWHDGVGYWDLDGVFHPGNGTGSGVGDEDNDNSYMEEAIVHDGDMSMPYFFNNNDPTKIKYSEARLTLSDTRDWTDEGVKALSLWFQGYSAFVGSFTDNLDGTYTMTASGTDIWAQADEFHFAYKPLSSAGSLIARVDSVDNTDDWAKAGVMIRDSLDPNAMYAFMLVSPGGGVAYQRRIDTAIDAVGTTVTGIAAPQWVKIQRDVSGFFTASYSSNGSTWEIVDAAEQIFMGSNVFIGLALTAHNANATCQAEFSNMQVSVSGPWANQDIGILSNDPERIYVSIANSNGTTGTVYYEDNDNIVEDATQMNTWTEFNIDLKDFQDQGVNLADVNSIAIGIGTRGSTTVGGAGKVYIDDIRLYRPRCVPEKVTLSEADFNSDCVVDFRDLEMMTSDWLANNSGLAVDLNTDSMVGFKDYSILAAQWLDEQLWPE